MYSLFSFQNESEIIPFPNKENEFELPEEGYTELKEKCFPRLSHPASDSEEKPDKTETGEDLHTVLSVNNDLCYHKFLSIFASPKLSVINQVVGS
ncbi:hypothetical protein DPMN_082441 [Dreissena polymorpha]|uniref:Uncharacterized protein n=1 Tax=Dreissena polymorpha TaxID=45954 RepID=A0A9D3YAL7_DREPO|nr:hypothetical protein DPMN_082441 [Dreissena polymorpha]